jgi:lipopolysaccharide transport system permease protein
MRYEIKPAGDFKLGLKELWMSRELLFMLALRDFKVRYSQTFLGVLWAVVQPLTTLFIFVLVFSLGIKVDIGKIPYPVFALTGMLAWNYFSFVMSQAGSSIINSQSIITKIYFPKLVIPISKTVLGVVDFFITLILTLILILYYHVPISIHVIFLPLFLLLLFLFSLSAGIFLSALSIRYRDVQNTIPFLTQIGLYLAPIAYPSSIIPEKYQTLFFLNPMAGIAEGFRWCIIGSPQLSQEIMAYTIAVILLFFITSIFYFRKVEDIIADIV